MIHINLLPGSGQGRTSRVPIKAFLTAATSHVKDPFLLASVASVALAVGTVSILWLGQNTREQELTLRHEQAAQDSARYATIVAEKRKAEARRDSVMRQVAIIKAIDEDRFVWAHILDEVSRSLTPYTWLTSISPTTDARSPAQKRPSADSAIRKDTAGGKTAAQKKAAMEAAIAAVDSIAKPLPVHFQVEGRTADLQALTRFMRNLEDSPFIQKVQLIKSTAVLEDGSAITQFTLTAEFEAPDPAATRRVPITVLTR
jgi:Tfp pilus assembly protein PilN